MKLLVTGASGLLGSEFVTSAIGRGFLVATPSRARCDVTDPVAVMREILEEAPDVVVHCAGYTAVDEAESHPGRAMLVNRDGTANVAAAAATAGAKLVHISSDYVFDGTIKRPYRPEDAVAPISVYGKTKAASEVAALGAPINAPVGMSRRDVQSLATGDAKRPLVIRTGWLYGGGGRSFVDTVVERVAKGEAMRVVEDQRGSPTWARDVADATLDLTLRGASGVWHVAAAGQASWLDVAKVVAALTMRAGSAASGNPGGAGADRSDDPTAEVSGVTSAEWGAPAMRPAYSVLDLTETERALGRTMPDWKRSLERFMTTVARSATDRSQLR